MNIYLKRTIKSVILLLVFVLLFCGIQNILRHKCIYKLDETPETEMWEEFYSLEKNTVDVFFIGSSHVYNGINAAEVYELTGHRAFDLATSNQDFFTAYYLLKEALKRQSPKLVVLETFGFHQNPFRDRNYDKNAYYKMAFDDMRLSSNKIKAVLEWKKGNDEINVVERLFPVFEYHSRWEELNAADYSNEELRSVILGYAQTFKREQIYYNGYESFEDVIPCSELALEYFYKIKKLCEDNGIDLVLVTVPDSIHDPAKSASISKVAEDNELIYIDYNEASNLSRLSIPVYGWRDRSHMNDIGAEVLTKGIVDDLSEYGFLPYKERNDSHYEKRVEDYRRVQRNQYVKSIDDFDCYLSYVEHLLENEDYAVFCAAQGEAFDGLNTEEVEKLNRMAPGSDFSDCYGRSYIFVLSNEEAWSSMDLLTLSANGKLCDGAYYEIESVGWFAGTDLESGSYVTMKINGKDYAENFEGLNFLIYDVKKHEVFDSCAFTTNLDTIEIVRTNDL